MNFEPPAKKVHTMKKIGTHNGTFHCDEVLACFMLKLLDEYKEAEIIRTRDPEVLATCDVVVDVGGVYDPETKRYDHHQRSFSETMNTLTNGELDHTIKLSSAGLVYHHYGHKIISDIVKKTEEVNKAIFKSVYKGFIEEVDAIDNGIPTHEGEPKYSINTNLSSRVGNLNPKWNDKETDSDVQFKKAMEIAGGEFLSKIYYLRDSWLPARELVKKAIEERFQVDESGEIIKFPQGGVPWKGHFQDLESELDVQQIIKYVLYEDENKKWRIQCVPTFTTKFENRLSLPEAWRGLRNESLSKVVGIDGCIFVHAGGFIGGHETYEGVLEMAKCSLKTQQSHSN